MGNPIDDATQQRINDRIKEVLATFGTEFSKVNKLFGDSYVMSNFFRHLTECPGAIGLHASGHQQRQGRVDS